MSVKKYNITREEQDTFALKSYDKSSYEQQSWESLIMKFYPLKLLLKMVKVIIKEDEDIFKNYSRKR